MITHLQLGYKLILCFFFFVNSAVGQQSLQAIVTEQFTVLKGLAHEPGCKLELSNNNPGSHSLMNGSKIVINLPQLSSLIKSVGQQHAIDQIRLILAHELAHQMQYRFYGRISNVLLSECQADVLAGFLLFQLKGQDYVRWMDEQGIQEANDSRLKKRINFIIQELYAALTVIFNLGDPQADNDHPRNEERRRAVREGIAYGNLWLANSVNNDPNVPKEKKIATFKAEKNYKELVGFLPEDNVITWSLRQAKKIIHYPRKNCKDIVVYNNFSWNTSADSPYINYHQKLMNIGSSTITVNFFNQTNTVSREEPDNSLLWDLRFSKAYSLTLRPGETKIIDDRLEWTASENLMPNYNCLGYRNSLYYCSMLDAPETVTKSLSHSLRVAPTTLVEEKNLIDILFSERNNLPRHITSVGTSLDEEDFNTVYYESSLRPSSADLTRIIYNREDNLYSIQTTWEGKHYSNEAFEACDQLKKVIQQIGMKVGPEKKRTKASDWKVLNEDSERVGNITLQVYSTKNYYLKLTIYAD